MKLFGLDIQRARAEVPMVTKSVPNFDSGFFWGVRMQGNISTDDIESKPYQYHWAIYSCARTISWNVARLPKVFQVEDGKRVDRPDILDLLGHPNFVVNSRFQFFQAIILGLLLPSRTRYGTSTTKGGQCFIVGVMPNGNHCDFAKGEIPAQLYTYTDEYFSASRGPDRHFRGWDFSIANEPTSKDFYETREVIRIYNYNPYDWFAGLSAFMPATIAILGDIKADVWNNRLYDNDAVPTGVLSSTEALSAVDVGEARSRWYEQQGGPSNARKIAVLGKGMEFQSIAVKAADMEFIEHKKEIVEQITAAFGLNKIALGKYENINRATIDVARRILWHDTYIPIAEMIDEAITSQWIKNIDPRTPLTMVSDTSKVPALKEDMDKPIASMKNLYDMGVPTEMAARLCDVHIDEDDIAKYPWLAEKPAGRIAPFAQELGDESLAQAPTPPAKRVRILADARDAFSRAYIEKVLDPGEKHMQARLVRFFNDQRNEMQDKVDAWAARHGAKSDEKIIIDPGIFLLNIDKETDRMLAQIYRPAVIEQLHREAAELKQELGDKLIGWNVTNPMIDHYVRRRHSELKEINTTTFERCRDKISAAVKAGEAENYTISEYAKAIKQALGDVGEIRKNQSVMIARTETGIISSDARFEAFKAAGIEYKQWVNAHDEKVRETHADGTGDGGLIIGINDIFPNTNLRYPLEYSGAPGEIINCVLPGTTVSGAFIGALKTFYSGEAIEIIAGDGNRVCVTVNHPIATDSGFVPAHSLNKGDNIVCHCGDAGVFSASWDADKQYGEASVEDVFNTIEAHGTSWIKTPTSLDLDGDGKFLREQINFVAGSSSLVHQRGIFDQALMGKIKAPFMQFANEVDFVSSDRPAVMFPASTMERMFGSPGFAALSSDCIGVLSDESPLVKFRFGLAADMNISRYEYTTDNPAIYSVFLRDLIFAHPGEIFIDNVASIRRFRYSGHVYDLQSSVGYFNSNNIISRNCRCVLLSSVEGE